MGGKRLIIKKINNIYGNYWLVRNKKKELLGTFSYDKPWKDMVWSQALNIKMSLGCLRELDGAMDRRLKGIKK